MMHSGLFYFLDSFMDELLRMFCFKAYYVIGIVSRSEDTRVVSVAQYFYGFSRRHAKRRFRHHSSIVKFDRVIAWRV